MKVYAPDPYRPRVKVLLRPDKTPVEHPYEIDLWASVEGEPRSVKQPVDPAEYNVDPLTYL